jgi:hypothetical protein
VEIPFTHKHSAHCESGVTANLLRHRGLEISEALAFGIGGGLFFGYLPFIRINQLPLITFRKGPGGIFGQATRRLGVKVGQRTFRSPAEAGAALDEVLSKGVPVGLQTGVYWLPYFPPALRFHFNAHNLVVYGREGENYQISDPVLDVPVLCAPADLERARFAKGALAPRGRMYYLEEVPARVDLPKAVRAGIREVTGRMVRAPVPIIGVRGIRMLSRRLEQWPHRLGEARALLYLGHLIRMQEEIGTGGGGFRFMYAAFLQEAAAILGEPRLQELSREMTEVGDRWREFALFSARLCKGRSGAGASWPALALLLRQCAEREEAIFTRLWEMAR